MHLVANKLHHYLGKGPQTSGRMCFRAYDMLIRLLSPDNDTDLLRFSATCGKRIKFQSNENSCITDSILINRNNPQLLYDFLTS